MVKHRVIERRSSVIHARHWLAIAVMLAVSACKDQAPLPTVTGTWKGVHETLAFTFVLTQSGSAVTGNGVMVAPSESVPLTVTGTYVAPNLSINVTSTEFQDFNFAGLHGATTIAGTLNGSGFVNDPLTLTKQ